ncbi:unnamed protein product, partial [Ectocarpus sp. 12 AP-2014]
MRFSSLETNLPSMLPTLRYMYPSWASFIVVALFRLRAITEVPCRFDGAHTLMPCVVLADFPSGFDRPLPSFLRLRLGLLSLLSVDFVSDIACFCRNSGGAEIPLRTAQLQLVQHWH